MSAIHTTQIDERCRPGALKGLVHPRERYEVERISEVEIRFRLLQVAQPARPRLIKKKGMTMLSGRRLTRDEVYQALEEFP